MMQCSKTVLIVISSKQLLISKKKHMHPNRWDARSRAALAEVARRRWGKFAEMVIGLQGDIDPSPGRC
jgi:hypothetical protein